MTVTQRNATTVYDRSNFTILDVYNLSAPIPANYTADLFLQAFRLASTYNNNSDSLSLNLAFANLVTVESLNGNSADEPVNGVQVLTNLKRLMALPVLVYNSPFLTGEQASSGEEIAINFFGALAVPHFRVKTNIIAY